MQLALHRLDSNVRLAAGLDEVWGFFSDPRNLPLITPSWLGLRITSPLPPEMYPGMIIAYTIAPFLHLRAHWVTEITHVIDRRLFVDEQRAGPYRFWHHQHHFREVEGGTEAEDIVHYALPFGPLGDLLQRLRVRRKLDEIFTFRLAVLRDRFGLLSDPSRAVDRVPPRTLQPHADPGLTDSSR